MVIKASFFTFWDLGYALLKVLGIHVVLDVHKFLVLCLCSFLLLAVCVVGPLCLSFMFFMWLFVSLGFLALHLYDNVIMKTIRRESRQPPS